MSGSTQKNTSTEREISHGDGSKPKLTMFFLEELIDKARNLGVPCCDQGFWLIAVIATLDTVDGRVTEKSVAQDLPFGGLLVVGKWGGSQGYQDTKETSWAIFKNLHVAFSSFSLVTVPSFVFTKIVHRIRIRTSDPIFEPEKTAIRWELVNVSIRKSGHSEDLKNCFAANSATTCSMMFPAIYKPSA